MPWLSSLPVENSRVDTHFERQSMPGEIHPQYVSTDGRLGSGLELSRLCTDQIKTKMAAPFVNMLQAGRKEEGGRVVRKEGMIEGRKERPAYKRGEDFILEEHIKQKKTKRDVSSVSA